MPASRRSGHPRGNRPRPCATPPLHPPGSPQSCESRRESSCAAAFRQDTAAVAVIYSFLKSALARDANAVLFATVAAMAEVAPQNGRALKGEYMNKLVLYVDGSSTQREFPYVMESPDTVQLFGNLAELSPFLEPAMEDKVFTVLHGKTRRLAELDEE